MNLRSIKRNGFRTQVVVVDDGSKDGTSDSVRQLFPDTVVLNGDGNLWWSGAINLGIKYSLDMGCDYVLTLNDDTRFDENFLEALFCSAEANPNTIVGSLMAYEDSVLQRFHYLAGVKQVGYLRSLVGVSVSESSIGKVSPITVDALPGRSLLIPMNIIRSIGLFDSKRFPHGSADFDFTLRAGNKGYGIIVDTRSIVYSDLNRNNFRIFVVTSERITFLKSLFSIKYSQNLKHSFYSSFMHRPWHAGLIVLLITLLRTIKWLVLKIVLPNKLLRHLILIKNKGTMFSSELMRSDL